LGSALEARGVPAGEGKLVADVTGEVEETDDGVIVLRRVHVRYTLRAETDVLADDAKRQAIDRAHDFHARKCPVARSIGSSVDITTDLELVLDA
jgi:uncharacterized OsmC-like protein